MVNKDDLSLNLRGHYAGFVTRMLALILDMLIIAAAVLIFSVTMRLILSFFGITELIQALPITQEVQSRPAAETLTAIGIAFVLNIIFFSVYQTFFWLVAGATPGKALIGLRVVPQQGQKLKFKQALVRALGFYVSAFVFFLGFLTVLVNERRQAWHDRWANTYVLYDWDARLGRRALLKLGIERPELLDQPLSPELQQKRQAYLQQRNSKPS